MRTKLRLLVSGAVVAVSLVSAAGSAFAWSPLQTYSSSTSTTLRQGCSWQPVFIAGLLNYRNSCTGEVRPALR